jgi:hypothetical protein
MACLTYIEANIFNTFLFAIGWHDFAKIYIKLEEILKGNLNEISIFLNEILVQIRKK